MWSPDPNRLVKVRLRNGDEDIETPWAEDLGPAPGEGSKRLVKLGNVPFLHAKPTYEDVLETQAVDGLYEWDARGLAFEQIGSRIAVDGGRWVMIVDYRLVPECEGTADDAFRQLDLFAEEHDMALEGAFVAPDRRSGRAYLAVARHRTSAREVMELIGRANLPLKFALIHPNEENSITS